MKFPGTLSLEFSFLLYDTALTPSPLLLGPLNLARLSVSPAQPDHSPWCGWTLLSSQAHTPPFQPETATRWGEPGPFKSHQQVAYRRSFWENSIYFLHPGRNNHEFWHLWTSQFFPCSSVTPSSTQAFSLLFKKINWNLNTFFYPPKIFMDFF